MNKLFLIGNLTRDPELRKTPEGRSVCNFTVAVNRRSRSDHPEADYFRVTCWDGTADNCFKYLAKGRKVNVIGRVRLDSYTDRDGALRYNLKVDAQEVEFLTPKGDTSTGAGTSAGADAPATDAGGYVQVDDEELPEFG
mgnify:CR=1 FL=1